MANSFTVDVVAADKKLFSGDAVSLLAPGADGYFGVLRGHAPLVAALQVGELEITPADNRGKILIAVSGGFIEVTQEHVEVLADSAELAAEIDLERARQAHQRAEERLRQPGEDIDVERAEAALARASNRLRVAERHGL